MPNTDSNRTNKKKADNTNFNTEQKNIPNNKLPSGWMTTANNPKEVIFDVPKTASVSPSKSTKSASMNTYAGSSSTTTTKEFAKPQRPSFNTTTTTAMPGDAGAPIDLDESGSDFPSTQVMIKRVTCCELWIPNLVGA